jgi:hypothetical protein
MEKLLCWKKLEKKMAQWRREGENIKGNIKGNRLLQQGEYAGSVGNGREVLLSVISDWNTNVR